MVALDRRTLLVGISWQRSRPAATIRRRHGYSDHSIMRPDLRWPSWREVSFGGDCASNISVFHSCVMVRSPLSGWPARMSGLVPVNGRLLMNALVIAANRRVSGVEYAQYPETVDKVWRTYGRFEPPRTALQGSLSRPLHLIHVLNVHDTWEWTSIKIEPPSRASISTASIGDRRPGPPDASCSGT